LLEDIGVVLPSPSITYTPDIRTFLRSVPTRRDEKRMDIWISQRHGPQRKYPNGFGLGARQHGSV
jgi:hypothetical protein